MLTESTKGKLQPSQLLSPLCQPGTLTTGELHDTGRVHASTAQQLLSEISHLRSTKQGQVKYQCPKKLYTDSTSTAGQGQPQPSQSPRPAQQRSGSALCPHTAALIFLKDPRGVVSLGSLALQNDGWHHEVLRLLTVLVPTYHELSLAALLPPQLADSTTDLLRPQHSILIPSPAAWCLRQ